MRIRRVLTSGVLAASLAVPTAVATGFQAQAATGCTGPRVSTVSDGNADSLRSWTKVQLDFCGGAQQAGDVVTITIPAGSPLMFNKGTYDIVGQDKVTVIGKLVSTGTTATITFAKGVDERGWNAFLWASVTTTKVGTITQVITQNGVTTTVTIGNRIDDCDTACQAALPVGDHQKWTVYDNDSGLIYSGLWQIANGGALSIKDTALDQQVFDCSAVNVTVNPNQGRTSTGANVTPDVYNAQRGVGVGTEYQPQVTCSPSTLTVSWPKTTRGYWYYLSVAAKPTNRGHLESNGLYAYGDTGNFSQANVGNDTQQAYVYGGGGSAYQHLPTPQPAPMPPSTVTVNVQVDAYGWGSAVGRKNSAWFGNKIAAFDDDSVLRYREDGWLWQSPTAKQYTTFRSKILTLTLPVGYTKAQLIAAINKQAAANGFAKLTTTAKLGAVGVSGRVTDYWMLGAGASAAKPWGPAYNVNQVFVGRG